MNQFNIESIKACYSKGADNLLFPKEGQFKALFDASQQSSEYGVDSIHPKQGELWLFSFDLRTEMTKAIEFQKKCFSANAAILFISQTPGCVNIGPLAMSGQDACIRCWQKRVQNNHREPLKKQRTDMENLRAQYPITSATKLFCQNILEQKLQKIINSPSRFYGEYIRITLADMVTNRHVFQPVIDCKSCQMVPKDSAERADITFTSKLKNSAFDKRVENPKLSLSAVKKQFVDRHSGVIKHVYQSITSSLMPMYAAEMQLMDSEQFESGYGRAESVQQSQLVAILEGIERYAGYSPKRVATHVRGSFTQLRKLHHEQCIDPKEFILHLPEHQTEKFNLLEYHENLEFNWCWGYSMKQKRPVLLPEQLVYYRLEDDKEAPLNRFIYDSSNGCAMGGCIEEAVLCGLHELIERDAYLTTWYSQISPLKIANNSITDSRSKALIARAEAEGLEIHLFNMMFDIKVPAVWAMIVDPRKDAPVKSYCASAAHGQWQEAVFAALVEIVTSMGVYQRSMPERKEQAVELLNNNNLVEDMPDHVLLYSLEETFERLKFLLDGETITLAECEEIEPSLYEQDIRDELFTQANKVLGVAHDVIVVKQSNHAMEALGLHCVKVLAPGLLPVTFGHQHRRVSYQRLDNAGLSKGHSLKHFNAETINTFPHNFP